MPIRIACLEDEAPQAEALKDSLLSWGYENNIKPGVDLYQGAEQFLFELDGKGQVPYDLLLLDISMGEMDGFSLAEKIREKDRSVKIAFLTSDPSRVFDGYEVGAFRYLLKPVTQEKLAELMTAFLAGQKESEESYVLLEVSGESVKVALSAVKYVEADGHYVNVVTDTESLRLHRNYKDVLEQLNAADHMTGSAGNDVSSAVMAGSPDTFPLFTECRRGLTVNISRVDSIGKEELCLDDGTRLPVSRGCVKQVNSAFIVCNRKEDMF